MKKWEYLAVELAGDVVVLESKALTPVPRVLE